MKDTNLIQKFNDEVATKLSQYFPNPELLEAEVFTLPSAMLEDTLDTLNDGIWLIQSYTRIIERELRKRGL